MKHILAVLLIASVLAGCGSASPSQPAFTDNGQPGQIKVIVFYDQNGNRTLDQGEPGLSDRVSISQDVSCPASRENLLTKLDTDPSGTALFTNLKPGHYCVAYMGSKGSTTKLTIEVDVSSEQVVPVYFGLNEP
jgi:uncharacterized protein (DUF2141 family)